MQVPLQITLRNIDPTPAIEDRIHKKADKLSQYPIKLFLVTLWSNCLSGTNIRVNCITCGLISLCRGRNLLSIGMK
ncbi:HPF/RaiA family ribosome-associated protein [Coxiella burnetii]|nr:HPF/RaiA family ribosome-associated protein [Coxiella burnetii]